MKEKVREIINGWDPIDLFPYSPKDEYEVEINLIVDALCETKDIEFLAIKIKDIFIERFGDNVFSKNIGECMQIAKKVVISE